MNIKLTRTTLAIVAAGVLLGGCGGSGGGNGLPKISSVNPQNTGKLQLSVGTVNIAGTVGGLNVVSSYRQSNGLSNALVNSPTLTGPFTFGTVTQATIAAGSVGTYDSYGSLPNGYGALDAAGSLTSTPYSIHLGTAPCDTGCGSGGANTSTFGQSGGVYTNGLAPANANNSSIPASYQPYNMPMFATLGATAVNVTAPIGGPPAFDPNKDGMGLRDGLQPLGSNGKTAPLGIPEGFTVFNGLAAASGTYTLAVTVPTTSTSYSASATATLNAGTTLPTITAPTLTEDGSGGGTITLPAADFAGGITEVYVQVVDWGPAGGPGAGKGGAPLSNANCQGALGAAAFPVYYTLVATAAGAITLGDSNGPNVSSGTGPSALTPSMTICTAAANTTALGTATAGDNYTIQAIGLDYDMYGATYPNNKSQTPTLAGSGGQSDITISAAPTQASVTPYGRHRP